jgi:hypothetical protein
MVIGDTVVAGMKRIRCASPYRGFYLNNERAPDIARRSKPGFDFVVSGHCTISMKAHVWRRPSTRESITLPHSPPHRRPRLVPV